MGTGKLLTLLQETGAMLEGHFLLTSGRHSNIYIEKFRILENPYALDEICLKMASLISKMSVISILIQNALFYFSVTMLYFFLNHR